MTSLAPLASYLDDLAEMGIAPCTWDQVLVAAQASLGQEGVERLRRHHRAFAAYPTQGTLRRFYGFCYAHGLHQALASYRAHRLARVFLALDQALQAGQRILEVGAGGGHVLLWLQKRKSPRSLSAFDAVPEAQALWSAQESSGSWTPWLSSSRFDVLLCVDSLGEIHGDHDGLLSAGKAETVPDLPSQMRERYGFAEKLEAWRPSLADKGRILLFEPIAEPRVWQAMAEDLSAQKWRVIPWQSDLFLPHSAPFLTLQNASFPG